MDEAPIKIADLKEWSEALDLQAMVVLTVERDGTVSVVTWGEDKGKCKAIGDWGQGLWKYAVSIIPFQTVFGWGFGGTPTPATSIYKKPPTDKDTTSDITKAGSG